jgi:hypothetical protein
MGKISLYDSGDDVAPRRLVHNNYDIAGKSHNRYEIEIFEI